MRAEREFRLRSIAVAVLLPVLLFEIGIAAVLPVFALSAVDVGGSLATAGFVVALLPVGKLIGDLPAGAFAARVGDRRAMIAAAAVTSVTLTVCGLAQNVWVLAAGVLATGLAGAVFGLARHTYLTEVTPMMHRARVLSTLAGVIRIGLFVGPFAGAGVMHLVGLRGAYLLAVTLALVTVVAVLLTREPAHTAPRRERIVDAPRVTVRGIVREHRAMLSTLGLAVVLVGVVRGARQTVLPLWTEHLGFSPATTSVIFGLCGAVDMLLFYPAGKIMDTRGRLWIGVPSQIIMAASMILLPLSHTVGAVTVVALLMGFGNGIGSGILMTLGADVAPRAIRARFLSVWRLLADSGNAAGPLVVAAGAAVGTLAGGILTIGAVSVASAAALQRWVPRWSEHANRATRRAAAERAAGERHGPADPDDPATSG